MTFVIALRPLSCVVNRGSSIVRNPLTILHFNFFSKATRQIITNFGLKHFLDKSINCETDYHAIPKTSLSGPTGVKFPKIIFSTFTKNSLNASLLSIKSTTKIMKSMVSDQAPGWANMDSQLKFI